MEGSKAECQPATCTALGSRFDIEQLQGLVNITDKFFRVYHIFNVHFNSTFTVHPIRWTTCRNIVQPVDSLP